jgi:hypothetical protein
MSSNGILDGRLLVQQPNASSVLGTPSELLALTSVLGGLLMT